MTSEVDIERLVQRFAKMRELAAKTAREHASDARAQDAAAQAFLLTGDYLNACRTRQRIRTLNPNDSDNLYQLGVVQEYLGEFGAARRSYEMSLDISPQNHRARYALVRMVKQTPAHNQIAELTRQFEQPDAQGWRSLFLGHALAKTYEDFDDLDASFRWLKKGKQRRNAIRPYSKQYERDVTDVCLASADGIAESNTGSQSSEPIFVCGLPRSGTTLVDRILSSHPEVSSAGEIDNFIQLVSLSAAAMRGSAPGIVAGLREANGLEMLKLGERYVASTRPLTGSKAKFVDKAPSYYLWAGLIHRALPNARIVCVARGPLDLCLANYRQIFPIDDRYYDYANDLAAAADKVIQFNRAANHWRQRLPGDRFMVLSYEDLVHDQQGQTRALLAFCGLPWDDKCLSFHQNAAAVGTPSAAQVREPMHAGGIGRWRCYASLLDPAVRVLAAAGLI